MAYIGPQLTKQYLDEVSHEWNWVTMDEIAGAESGWNTTAKSPTDDWGLFQINRYWHRDLFEAYDWWKPLDNTKMAYHVWKSQHYHGWSTYTNGDYLRYASQVGRAGSGAAGGGQGQAYDIGIDPPPGPGELDYSKKVSVTGQRLRHAFGTIHNTGLWLRQIH